MLVPLSWLKDFTPIELDARALGEVFSDLGLVVEGIEHVGGNLEGVVVGHVLDVRPHPNADKVRLADVDLGDGQPLQIACGASNLQKGQLVPVATIGAVLPGDFKIERRKLRGEWSNGMICSSDELGLSKARAGGILVLPEGLTIGASLVEAMGIVPDVVFDLDIETNRPDALCIAGVARDVAARLQLPFAIPEPVVKESDEQTSEKVSIVVERPDLAPRFTARVISNVEVGPSPELIAQRLTLAGMRPINNIVDASNYVMLEFGQPSHPYDLARIPGSGLRVRAARQGEVLKTLDDVERPLTERDCVICDAQDNVIGVAGIMGGESSEISDTTTEVLLEAAVFDSFAVNYTSRRLALRTDASARFERRVDPAALERAQNRFCEILQLSSVNAAVAAGIVDISAPAEPPVQVKVRTARVNKVLGTSLTGEQICAYLKPLGFTAVPAKDSIEEAYDVTIPTFRPDSDREIDVIEEIARMHGYSNIERTVPKSPRAGGLSPYQQRRRQLRAWLAGRGITEAWSATLLAAEDFEKAGLSTQDAIELANPIAAEESKLRTTLLPGMLRAVAFNAARRHVGVRLFDIGHVFNTPLAGELLPNERERVAVLLAGEGDDATTAVALWRDLLASLRIEGTKIVNAAVPGLHPTRSAEIRAKGGDAIGVIGEVDPAVLAHHGIEGRAAWIEVDAAELFERVVAVPQMRSVSRFPAAEFDLAFLVPDAVQASAVESTLRNSAGDLLERIALFDVFHGPQVGEGVRSLAFRLTVAHVDHTLSEDEVTEIRTQAIAAVEERHNASLRA